MTRLHSSLAVLAGLGCALALACSDAPINPYCTGIPAHGCPGDDETNCVDPSCEAIYSYSRACVWTFVQKCPGYVPLRDAGADARAQDGGADASSDAQLQDASFPLPEGAAGGPNCEELQQPDCPVALAVQCKDCCGCQALWVCQGGGWNLWGQCNDAGEVSQVTQ